MGDLANQRYVAFGPTRRPAARREGARSASARTTSHTQIIYKYVSCASASGEYVSCANAPGVYTHIDAHSVYSCLKVESERLSFHHCAMAGRRKVREGADVLRPGKKSYVSMRGIEKLCADIRREGMPAHTSVKTLFRARQASCYQKTPYGLPLVQVSDIIPGTTIAVQNPAAMLYISCQKDGFARLMRATIAEHAPRGSLSCTQTVSRPLMASQNTTSENSKLCTTASQSSAHRRCAPRKFGLCSWRCARKSCAK